MSAAPTLNRGLKPTTWHDALRRCRVDRGASHHDVANFCGVPKAKVREWEAGESVPAGLRLHKLYVLLPQLKWFTMLLPRVVLDKAAEDLDTALRKVSASQRSVADLGESEKTRLREKFGETFAESAFWIPPLPEKGETIPAELSAALPPSATFGAALARARLASGLTQDELGDLVEVTGQAVSSWERDCVAPVRAHYDRLLVVYDELAGGPKPAVQDLPPPDGGAGVERLRSGGHLGGSGGVDRIPAPRLNSPVVAARVLATEPDPEVAHPDGFGGDDFPTRPDEELAEEAPAPASAPPPPPTAVVLGSLEEAGVRLARARLALYQASARLAEAEAAAKRAMDEAELAQLESDEAEEVLRRVIGAASAF